MNRSQIKTSPYVQSNAKLPSKTVANDQLTDFSIHSNFSLLSNEIE
jgi:hypothetical protein